ncbi:vq motif-containing protein [Abeliophyllum distichum]|uniref:Vq motif-containing protein n=1 Tax=Abeliophyllum distichum TaxID=126358 RepID=A0ABD1V590_9LAMI
MDMYSYSYSYSSSSSSSSSYQEEEKRGKHTSDFRSALHSVRKLPMKPMKKPIAPFPPIPPKIYKVDPVNFKEVVQKLTSAHQFQSTRLQEVAPPPLSLSPPWKQPLVQPNQVKTPPASKFSDFMTETYEEKAMKPSDYNFGALSPLGFNMSPSSLAWCSSFLFSPGTLSSLEPSAVL